MNSNRLKRIRLVFTNCGEKDVYRSFLTNFGYVNYSVNLKFTYFSAFFLNFFLTAMCAESCDDIRKRAENGEDWVALRHELLY